MTPGNRIEALRNASGMSRAGVADRLGVTERTVYRWERGDNPVPDEQKLKLAELFGGVSVVHMMGWEDNGNNGDSHRRAA